MEWPAALGSLLASGAVSELLVLSNFLLDSPEHTEKTTYFFFMVRAVTLIPDIFTARDISEATVSSIVQHMRSHIIQTTPLDCYIAASLPDISQLCLSYSCQFNAHLSDLEDLLANLLQRIIFDASTVLWNMALHSNRLSLFHYAAGIISVNQCIIMPDFRRTFPQADSIINDLSELNKAAMIVFMRTVGITLTDTLPERQRTMQELVPLELSRSPFNQSSVLIMTSECSTHQSPTAPACFKELATPIQRSNILSSTDTEVLAATLFIFLHTLLYSDMLCGDANAMEFAKYIFPIIDKSAATFVSLLAIRICRRHATTTNNTEAVAQLKDDSAKIRIKKTISRLLSLDTASFHAVIDHLKLQIVALLAVICVGQPCDPDFRVLSIYEKALELANLMVPSEQSEKLAATSSQPRELASGFVRPPLKVPPKAGTRHVFSSAPKNGTWKQDNASEPHLKLNPTPSSETAILDKVSGNLIFLGNNGVLHKYAVMLKNQDIKGHDGVEYHWHCKLATLNYRVADAARPIHILFGDSVLKILQRHESFTDYKNEISHYKSIYRASISKLVDSTVPLLGIQGIFAAILVTSCGIRFPSSSLQFSQSVADLAKIVQQVNYELSVHETQRTLITLYSHERLYVLTLVIIEIVRLVADIMEIMHFKTGTHLDSPPKTNELHSLRIASLAVDIPIAPNLLCYREGAKQLHNIFLRLLKIVTNQDTAASVDTYIEGLTSALLTMVPVDSAASLSRPFSLADGPFLSASITTPYRFSTLVDNFIFIMSMGDQAECSSNDTMISFFRILYFLNLECSWPLQDYSRTLHLVLQHKDIFLHYVQTFLPDAANKFSETPKHIIEAAGDLLSSAEEPITRAFSDQFPYNAVVETSVKRLIGSLF